MNINKIDVEPNKIVANTIMIPPSMLSSNNDCNPPNVTKITASINNVKMPHIIPIT